jgi:hypothetical protein
VPRGGRSWYFDRGGAAWRAPVVLLVWGRHLALAAGASLQERPDVLWCVAEPSSSSCFGVAVVRSGGALGLDMSPSCGVLDGPGEPDMVHFGMSELLLSGHLSGRC